MKAGHTRTAAGGVAVIGPLSKATQARLEEGGHGRLTKASDDPPIYVLETAARDLRALTADINAIIGSEAVVTPLLTDADGNKLLPTGRLQVRFNEPPSSELLERFAKTHKLELAGLNKWAPAQAEFAVRPDDTRYFPELESELQKDTSVKTAWADVKAAFRREST
jgi:hypothetical protein